MTILDDLRPTQKLLVMDLLEKAGFDVNEWANYKGKSPAANPKFCYNWSFEQPGECVAVCLWHRNLEARGGTVIYHRNPKRLRLRSGPGANVWNRRLTDFGQALELAYHQQLPIKAIIIEGDQRNPAELKPKASSVKARLLDTVDWAITEFDPSTGECVITRGRKPVVPASISSDDLELSWFEGTRKRAFIFHRRREAKARREKLRLVMASNSGNLICEVPNCGFDFKERYGILGEGYAQVHHLDPLNRSPKEGRPVRLDDLAVVCANCHAMIHLRGECRPLKGLIPPVKS